MGSMVAGASSVIHWLASSIDGLRPAWPTSMAGRAPSELVADAADEGVLALLAWRLRGPDTPVGVPDDVRASIAVAARDVAAHLLRREHECRLVLATCEEAGVPVLLLKGSALAYWLYPQPYLRECADIDLLFRSRADADRIAMLLEGQGYALWHSPGDLANEMLCRRPLGGSNYVEVDIHWNLLNAPLFAKVFAFDELHEASLALPTLAPNARGLSPVHAYAHGCMHRALNLSTKGDSLKWTYDLHLSAQRFGAEEWAELQALCLERDLCGVCAEGMDAAAALHGAVAPAAVRDALNAGRCSESLDAGRLGSWVYLQVRNLAAISGVRNRLRWLAREFLPARDVLQQIYGPGKGIGFLLWQRLRRLARRLRQ